MKYGYLSRPVDRLSFSLFLGFETPLSKNGRFFRWVAKKKHRDQKCPKMTVKNSARKKTTLLKRPEQTCFCRNFSTKIQVGCPGRQDTSTSFRTIPDQLLAEIFCWVMCYFSVFGAIICRKSRFLGFLLFLLAVCKLYNYCFYSFTFFLIDSKIERSRLQSMGGIMEYDQS